MSLETLSRLRATGRTPAAIWVVLGACPESIRDLPDTIAVTSKPAAMDWRPVTGIHVDLFDLGADNALLNETIGAIEQAQPKCLGVACDLGEFGLSDEHETAMRAIRRHLATHS